MATEQLPSDPSAPVSDTPKTDAAQVVAFYGGYGGLFVEAAFARAQERRIAELVKLCNEMLSDDADDGKPTWRSIYAIEDKLKEWGDRP